MDQILTFISDATLIKENDIMINLLKKSDSNKIIKSSFDFNFLLSKVHYEKSRRIVEL